MDKVPDSFRVGWPGRLGGIKEQFERAKLFLSDARNATDRLDRFRRLVACIYFSRAMVELMLEAADQQEIKKNRRELEEVIVGKLPYYMLIEKLRIHDFHRFGLFEVPGASLGGPFKLEARKGGISLQITPEGPKVATSGDSRVVWQRALLMVGDKAFDDETNEYISLEAALEAYLEAAPRVIEEVTKLHEEEK